MSGIKANWHLDVLPVEEDGADPFAVQQAQFEELAEPILLTDVPTLNRRLTDLMRRQDQLLAEGQDCALRWRETVICSACPIAGRFGELCEGSAEIERVTTELAIASGAPRQT